MPHIGIDIGTSFCSVAVFRDGKAEAIPGLDKELRIAATVAFADSGAKFGLAAAAHPDASVASVMRIVGLRSTDPFVLANSRFWPIRVVGDGERLKVLVERKNDAKQTVTELYSPEEIVAMLLTHLVHVAEKHLGGGGGKVKDVVLTCPAFYTLRQREGLLDAGRIAGLNVVQVLPSTCAAALADGFTRKGERENNTLVVDMGAGATSVSVIAVSGNSYEVRAHTGDQGLGGDDFDQNLVAHCADKILKKSKHDVVADKHALRLLRAACEHAKCALSASSEATVKVEDFGDKTSFKTAISRSHFEESCVELFARVKQLVEKVLIDGSYNRSQIDEIILVGGSARMPKVQSIIQTFFYGKKINAALATDAPAVGAAIQAALLAGDAHASLQKWAVKDALPHIIGIETKRGIIDPVLKRGRAVPARETIVYTTTADNQAAVAFRVLEGEGGMARDNDLVGEVVVTGIVPAAAGKAEVSVTIDVDAGHRVQVTASSGAAGADQASSSVTQALGSAVALTAEQITRSVRKMRKALDPDDGVGEKRADAPQRKEAAK